MNTFTRRLRNLLWTSLNYWWVHSDFLTSKKALLQKMHKKRVLCPFKGASRCHLHHFDAWPFRVWPFSHHRQTLTLRCLDFLFAITGPELLNVMVSDFAMDADTERFHFWWLMFFLVRKKVTSINTKQLIHSFRCLTTFFSPTSVLFCVKVCVKSFHEHQHLFWYMKTINNIRKSYHGNQEQLENWIEESLAKQMFCC